MQDKHNDDILAAAQSFLQSAGFRPNLSAHPKQPFRLGLIRHLLQLMQDPDIGLIDIAESGFHTGVFEPIRFSGIWRRQQDEAREDLPLKIYDTNWKSPKKTQKPCLDSSKRTSTPRSCRSSTVTLHKPKSVGQREWQLAASALQGRTSATRASAWTARYRMSMRKPRLKKSPSTRAWRHCLSQSGVALIRKSRSDDRRQQSTQKTPHPRRRMGASLDSSTEASSTITQCATLERDSALHGGAAWEQCLYASATSSFSFSTVDGCTSMTFFFVWKRQQRREWQHASAVFCISWDVPSTGTKLHWDDK